MNKGCKIGLGIGGTLVGLMVLVMALSPVVKWVANHYGQQLVGRQLVVDRVWINPFSGTVMIRDFHMREQNEQTDFVAFGELDVRVNYPLLLFHTVQVTHLYLTDFTGQVLNGDTCFNFSDLVDRFAQAPDSLTQETDTVKESRWAVSLDDIMLRNGHFVYHDVPRDARWAVENINLHIPGLYFGHKQSNAGLGFDLPTGGSVHLSAGYVMSSRRYAMTLRLKDVDMEVLEPILRDKLQDMGIEGRLSGNVHVDGGLNNPSDLLADVALTMRDFVFEDRKNDFRYKMDSIVLSGDKIAPKGRNNKVTIKAALGKGGKLNATYSGGFDLTRGSNSLTAKMTGVAMKDFSPYTESLMAYPIKDGTLACESKSTIIGGNLASTNRVTIDQLKIGNKKMLSRAPYKNIPLKTGVKLLQSAKGIIVLDLPISGDIRSPKFDLKKVIGRVVMKVFFGPLMGVNDGQKLITDDEAEELRELMGEDVANDTIPAENEQNDEKNAE